MRWSLFYQGMADSPRGPFNTYIFLQMHAGMTPEQVDACDPDYVEELLAAYDAKHRQERKNGGK